MKSSQNQTIDRGLDVLLLFDEDNPSLTINEIVKKLGIPRSTTYRFVQILKQKGLLESIGQGRYRPGWLTADLARLIRPRADLTELALPVMRALAKETKETVALTAVAGTKVSVIEHVESPQQLRLSYTTGQERPLHRGAPSKIILAYLRKEHRQVVLDKISATFDVETLEEELQLIRAQGYAVTSEEVDPDARGIAAPIFGPDKNIVAALTISGPLSRLNYVQLPKMVTAAKRAAEEIERLLETI
ncbi:IclR family transcriptional regulator [Aneurinibacillus sp. REN35]|uniref:IclR family transcriptional regulator n=1 Tax=Aneurinibacillus sp. REN35 TaxID=3237286 RepID=UPI0035281E1B